jgi:hypothetical protein
MALPEFSQLRTWMGRSFFKLQMGAANGGVLLSSFDMFQGEL